MSIIKATENIKSTRCDCGKTHKSEVALVIAENGAVARLPEVLSSYSAKKPFILADVNTYEAAGKKVCKILEENHIAFSKYVYADTSLEPDEHAVGSAVTHFDNSCDIIVAVGSGVINDIGKILAAVSNKIYIIIATAPSMDGYASSSSSMSVDGLKVSLASKSANVIIGDLDILSKAPIRLLQSGLGDMIAKYVSICEWRIAHIITGEYYCESVAELVRGALKKCVDNADGLLKRDEKAVKAVFEGLVIGGEAMAYAGVSRPASGEEHYLSHIWDMRGLEFGTNVDFHGIQCAIGTLISAKLYEQIRHIKPDREKALRYVKEFDFSKWSDELRTFLGKGAETMIALEAKEHKYSVDGHAKRLEIIIENWDRILDIINEELPGAGKIESLLSAIGAPKLPSEIGIDDELIPMTFKSSKDIRDKYVLSRLAWDLGIIDEII